MAFTIGITDCSKYENYAKWFEELPDLSAIKLSWKEKNYEELQRCDGLVLSGGEDVHPKFYGKPEYLKILKPEDIIEQRDEFEMEIIRLALVKQIPILGICRGLQIANVYFKGSLVPDLPSKGKYGHAKGENYDQLHTVMLAPESELKKIVGEDLGEVNSAHHQSADSIGEGLKVNATADDGTVEGLEYIDSNGKPFFLLVQWHPERMVNAASRFSKNIRSAFVKSLGKLL